jgi:hypothetical protein
MAEDQDGEGVMRAIQEALELATEIDPQAARSLRFAIVRAMSDYEDKNAQAAAALAAVLDFRPLTNRGAFIQTLEEIGGLVEGLHGLGDVRYTVETPGGLSARSIRSRLPIVSPPDLAEDELAAIEAFIKQHLTPENPRDERAPRGPKA